MYVGQWCWGAGVLRTAACPKLSAVAWAASGLEPIDDAILTRVVEAAARVSAQLDEHRSEFDPVEHSATVGALAFFHLSGRVPNKVDVGKLRRVVTSKGVDPQSLAYRWAWAHWCEQRELQPGRGDAPDASAGICGGLGGNAG